ADDATDVMSGIEIDSASEMSGEVSCSPSVDGHGRRCIVASGNESSRPNEIALTTVVFRKQVPFLPLDYRDIVDVSLLVERNTRSFSVLLCPQKFCPDESSRGIQFPEKG